MLKPPVVDYRLRWDNGKLAGTVVVRLGRSIRLAPDEILSGVRLLIDAGELGISRYEASRLQSRFSKLPDEPLESLRIIEFVMRNPALRERLIQHIREVRSVDDIGRASTTFRRGAGGSPSPRAAPPASRKRVEPRRWLLARVYDVSGSRQRWLARAFRAMAEHEVAVKVGAFERGWLTATDAPSLDAQLPRGAHRLTIVFFLPDLNQTQTEDVVLPRSGPTREVRFRFSAGQAGSRVRMLISVVYAGRTVQAGELSGLIVDDPLHQPNNIHLEFRIAVPMPDTSSLANREAFDGTLQVANASDGQVVGVAVRSEHSPAVLFPHFGQAPITIRDLLAELTERGGEPEPLDSPASVDFLRRLALAGGELYDVLGRPLVTGVDAAKFERVQVIQSDPDAFMPIEFTYDLEPPGEPAKLCENWRRALEDGCCEPRRFHHTNRLGDMEEVCPSGFWAVSKIIERQSVEQVTPKELEQADAPAWAEPNGSANRLGRLRSGLVAWSERVDYTVKHRSDMVLHALNEVTGGHASSAATWTEWMDAIVADRPSLLVLLTHTTDENPARLQIGRETSSDGRSLTQIKTQLVKAASTDNPVLLLLGCDTASVDRQAYSFAARFRAAGASVVFGTLSSILGEQAAPVATGLIRALTQARSEVGNVTLGEVWRTARRRLLANGDLAALCVIAYGDAGWIF